MSNRAPDGGITDDYLIELAVAGKSYGAIAKTVGLAKATVFQRLKKPECKAKVQEGRAEALREAKGILRAKSTRLARTLADIGTGKLKGSPEQVRAITAALRLAGLETTKHIEVSGGLRHLTDAELDAQERKLLAAAGDADEP